MLDYNDTVNDGWNDNVCPQVQLGWARKAMEFLKDFPSSSALHDKWEKPISVEDYGPMQNPPKPGTLSRIRCAGCRLTKSVTVSEDCLTLDVMVPKVVWDRRKGGQALGGKSDYFHIYPTLD